MASGYISIRPVRKLGESYSDYRYRRNRYACRIKKRFGSRVQGGRK